MPTNGFVPAPGKNQAPVRDKRNDGASSTARLIDGVAETTSLRDRDELDHAVTRLLWQFLDARSVALYRIVKDGAAIQVGHPILLQHEQAVATPAWLAEASGHEVSQYPGPGGSVLTAFTAEGAHGDATDILVVDTPSPLAPRDRHLVNGILRIIRNHLSLLDYGERDTLTGLLNRKTFEVQFDKLQQRLQGVNGGVTQQQGYLGLVDVDRFKSINDNYGHLFGDEVLLLIGQQMRRSFRDADHLYRFGGEEFLILLHCPNESDAEQAFERLRSAIATFEFPQVGRVTISLGWTRITPQDGPTTCVERADTALYYAKSHGRNQACRFETLAAAGALPHDVSVQNVELF